MIAIGEATGCLPGGKTLSTMKSYQHDEYSAHGYQLKVRRSCRTVLVERMVALMGCSQNAPRMFKGVHTVWMLMAITSNNSQLSLKEVGSRNAGTSSRQSLHV